MSPKEIVDKKLKSSRIFGMIGVFILLSSLSTMFVFPNYDESGIELHLYYFSFILGCIPFIVLAYKKSPDQIDLDNEHEYYRLQGISQCPRCEESIT